MIKLKPLFYFISISISNFKYVSYEVQLLYSTRRYFLTFSSKQMELECSTGGKAGMLSGWYAWNVAGIFRSVATI